MGGLRLGIHSTHDEMLSALIYLSLISTSLFVIDNNCLAISPPPFLLITAPLLNYYYFYCNQGLLRFNLYKNEVESYKNISKVWVWSEKKQKKSGRGISFSFYVLLCTSPLSMWFHVYNPLYALYTLYSWLWMVNLWRQNRDGGYFSSFRNPIR